MGLKKKLAGLVLAGGLLATGLGAAPAQAAPVDDTYKAPRVLSTGHVRFHGDQATVDARYRCYGGDEKTHIWVSLKQGRKIDRMSLRQLTKSQETSKIARSWYDTNPTDPSKGYNQLTCNGHTQWQRFLLTKEEGKRVLSSHERAFLQFCLFDSTADPASMDLNQEGFAFKYSKVHVQRVRHLALPKV
jgi:hypothetical protein